MHPRAPSWHLSADARECCGDGRFCDSGYVCTADPGLCCPAEQPVLCPNRRDCALDLSLCHGQAIAGISSVGATDAPPAGSKPAAPRLGAGGEKTSPLGR